MTNKDKDPNNEAMRKFKEEHGLTSARIAQILGVNIRTVESWVNDPSKDSHRTLRNSKYLEFLKRELEDEKNKKM